MHPSLSLSRGSSVENSIASRKKIPSGITERSLCCKHQFCRIVCAFSCHIPAVVLRRSWAMVLKCTQSRNGSTTSITVPFSRSPCPTPVRRSVPFRSSNGRPNVQQRHPRDRKPERERRRMVGHGAFSGYAEKLFGDRKIPLATLCYILASAPEF